jgi:glutamine cyclotransferase
VPSLLVALVVLLGGLALRAVLSDGDDVSPSRPEDGAPPTVVSTTTAAPDEPAAPATTVAARSSTTATGPTTGPPSDADPPSGALRPEVIRVIERDDVAFTQGFEIVGDDLIESSGLYGRSELRRVDPSDATVLDRVALPDDVFAEGLTVVDDRVIVLTWRERTAFVHDLDDLALTGTYSYETEGWGLCELADGRLAMSDGSATITFRDAGDFRALGTVEVTVDGSPLGLLNELECVGSTIWANVWQTDDIVAFDAADGVVVATVDASGLIEPDPADDDPDAVLNGIAHLGDGRFLITGKLWPAVFEVRFVPAR